MTVILEGIKVKAYGGLCPLREVATISVKGPHQLAVAVADPEVRKFGASLLFPRAREFKYFKLMRHFSVNLFNYLRTLKHRRLGSRVVCHFTTEDVDGLHTTLFIKYVSKTKHQCWKYNLIFLNNLSFSSAHAIVRVYGKRFH